MNQSQAPIHIVGAGLAGSLMALFLTRRGHRVRVIERRDDIRERTFGGGRSINLALSERGLTALRAVGLEDEVLEFAIPMSGRLMHSVDGELTFQAYGKEGQAINSVSRKRLNEVLIDAAEASKLAEFWFDTPVEDVDLETGAITVEKPDGSHETLDSALTIGADGAFSAVRLRMMKTDRFDYQQSYLEHGYKELHIHPTADGRFKMEKNALHIWPRHSYMMIALPNPDGSFTCTLFLAFEGESHSFEQLDTPEAVRAFFEEEFPDSVPLIDRLTEEFFENPTGSLCYVSCAPYHRGEKVVIIGDAAHAVVPFYGQGMNAAFEDCYLLDRTLAEHPNDPGAAIARYSRERKADADAIRDLALYNFIEMRSRVADEAFLQRKQLESVLSDAFGEHFLNLYGMVTFSTIPYAEARRRAAEQDELLDKRADAVLGLLTLAFFRELAGMNPSEA